MVGFKKKLKCIACFKKECFEAIWAWNHQRTLGVKQESYSSIAKKKLIEKYLGAWYKTIS
jgi:hypothetical protein